MLCYYSKSNLRHFNLYIHTLTCAPKIFVAQHNSCHFSRSWGSMYRPTCVMPTPLARWHAHVWRGSLHIFSFNSQRGSMSNSLWQILCRVDAMESSSCMLSRNPSSRWHPQRISCKEWGLSGARMSVHRCHYVIWVWKECNFSNKGGFRV